MTARGGGEETVEQWLPLVHWVIRRNLPAHVWQRIDNDDAFQAGVIGLMAAIRGYRGDQGAIFKTYAAIKIRWYILMAAGLTSQGWRPIASSLDAEDRLGRPLADRVLSCSHPDRSEAIDVQQAIAALPRRLQQVARLYWFDELTKAEVGAQLGVTRERGRQLVAETEGKLRALLAPLVPA